MYTLFLPDVSGTNQAKYSPHNVYGEGERQSPGLMPALSSKFNQSDSTMTGLCVPVITTLSRTYAIKRLQWKLLDIIY